MLTELGKLYYYKAPEDARQAKVPIDMNTLTSVSAVNGPLELELKVGRRALRLKVRLQPSRPSNPLLIALTQAEPICAH